MMNALPLRQLYYHRDYDGIVAAAMIQASTVIELKLQPVQYEPNLGWTEQSLAPETGIVDFLYHPAATLWIDHHATTFRTEAVRQSFRPDSFHVFAPDAPSCPSVIVGLPWFDSTEHWSEYVRWADIIDGAAYSSPAQANDLASPHLLLSKVIAELVDVDLLAFLVRAISRSPASQVLDLPAIHSIRARVLQDEARIRQQLSKLLRLVDQVAILDQSSLSTPYRRYLAYEHYPQVRYGIGLYRSDNAIIVSVGENPWNQPGPVHLGELCRTYGGGGRRSTAGVATPSVEAACALAEHLAQRLNEALRAKI